jgi:hypothetical protein
MSVIINGTTGIDTIQDNTVTSAKIVAGAVTPADTQVGALPSMVRLNTANGYGSSSTAIRRFTNVVTNQGTDITYADSATLGASFTINTNGVYAISYTDSMSANSHIGISLNSNQLTTSITSITTTNVVADVLVSTGFAASCGATMYLSSGDVIRPHNGGVSTGSQTNSVQFVITRVA